MTTLAMNLSYGITRRKWLISHCFVLAIVSCLILSSSSNAQPLITAQVATMKAGTWQGIKANVAWTSPPGPNGSTMAIPVGLTIFQSYPNAHFIETGPVRECRYIIGDCSNVHPYVSYNVPNVSSSYVIDFSRNLGSGINYGYLVERSTSSYFNASFCNASGCSLLLSSSVSMGRIDFPYLFIAGESSGPRWLTAAVTSATGRAGNTWTLYCYDSTLNYINVVDGRVTPCNNSAWKISYEYRLYAPEIRQ